MWKDPFNGTEGNQAMTDNGVTALMRTSENRHKETVERLIQHGGMEELSFTGIGDDQDKLDTFITAVKNILKDSNLAEKIIDRGFNAWLGETLKSEFDIPKYLTRLIIAPILSAIAVAIKKKLEKQAVEKTLKIAEKFRPFLNKILGKEQIYDGLIKAIQSIPSTSKQLPPVNLETLSIEMGEFRTWLEDKDLETSLKQALLNHDMGKHPVLLRWLEEEDGENDFKLDKIDWIKPGGGCDIPYVPSKKLQEALQNFTFSENQCSALVVTGPSGSGKTRLAIEWMKAIQDSWFCGFVSTGDSPWEFWQPVADTFIVIDYFNLSYKVAHAIFERMRFFMDQGIATNFHVRVLILDHRFDMNFESYFWREATDGGSLQTDYIKNKIFYRDFQKSDPKPVTLHENIDPEVVSSIIRKVAGEKSNDESIEKWINKLNIEKGMNYPLYAALAGACIRHGLPIDNFGRVSRRALLTSYLKGTKRLPFKYGDRRNLIASAYVCYSRFINGADEKSLRGTLLEDEEATPRDFDLANFIVGDKTDHQSLAAMTPDIVGETFVLLFFENNGMDIALEKKRKQVLQALWSETNDDKIGEILTFFDRTAQNICDDLRERDTTFYEILKSMCVLDETDNGPASSSFTRTSAIAVVGNALLREKQREEAKTIIDSLSDSCLQAFAAKLIDGNLIAERVYLTAVGSCNALFIERILNLPGLSSDEKLLVVRFASTDEGFTALMAASWNGHKEIVEQLIQHGAEVNQATTDGGATALMVASVSGHKEIVERLIQHRAEINQVTTDTGETALMWASGKGHEETVEQLIQHGADVNQARTVDGFTVLMAASQEGHEEIVERLIQNGAKVNQATTDNGTTALMAASQKGHKEIVERLIQHGAEVNQARTDTGATALMAASEKGHKEIVERLIQLGAEVNQARTVDGAAALMIASKNGHKKTVERLIQLGAEVNQARTDNGTTALMVASGSGHQEIVERLIQHGAEVNQATTDNGTTALMIASLEGHEDVVERLIQHGAEVNQARTDNGATALMAASLEGHEEIVERLVQHGAEVNQATTVDGATALMAASSHGHKEIVERLIQHGAEVNQAMTDTGATALMAARERGHQEIVELLIKHRANDQT